MAVFFKPGKLVSIMNTPTHAYTDPNGCVSYKNEDGEITVDPMGNVTEGAPMGAKWSDDSWTIQNANLRVARYRERMEEYDDVEDEEDL